MRKAIIAGVVAAVFMTAGAVATQAATNVDITIGKNKGISCGTGKRILEGKGYVNVQPRDCINEIYVYTALRNGKKWWIEVRRRDGRVIDTMRR
jgi:hypothetical protein